MSYPESAIEIDSMLEQLYDYPDRMDDCMDYDYFVNDPVFYGYPETTCRWWNDSVTYHESKEQPDNCSGCEAWLEVARDYHSEWHPELIAQAEQAEQADKEFALDKPLTRSEQRLLNRIEQSRRTRNLPNSVVDWLQNL